MEALLSWTRPLLLMVLVVISFTLGDCYDPLDPNGNITVKFDIHKWTADGYAATVTIQNFYQYRHVEKPGWQLGWVWTSGEVIWSMAGALAIKQGNCIAFTNEIPYSCRPDPVFMDLMPEAAPENRSENCCRAGLLSAFGIDQSHSVSSFELVVGNLGNNSRVQMPQNLTFMGAGPGYTCGLLVEYPPTVFLATDARREVQVFRTWKATCTYSNFVVNKVPTCCVSLSTFYNAKVTECPRCSCGCPPAENTTLYCVGDSFSLQSALSNPIQCTDHMCPVRVHWHIKNQYREYWRVKLTVSNYNYGMNYSDWNVVVQHPGFSQPIVTYSFNSTILRTVADTGKRLTDEVALFWGLPYYNTELVQAIKDQPGSVTTEILILKEPESFTLGNGWAFPRRVYFNGENCEMPLPDKFPGLPNSSSNHNGGILLLILVLFLSFKTLL